MRNEKIYYGIRLIAGAYIIYLAYNVLKDAAAGKIEENTALFVVLGIVFIVAGAAFIVWGVRGLKNSMSPDSRDAEEDAVESGAGESAELPEDVQDADEPEDVQDADEPEDVQDADGPEDVQDADGPEDVQVEETPEEEAKEKE